MGPALLQLFNSRWSFGGRLIIFAFANVIFFSSRNYVQSFGVISQADRMMLLLIQQKEELGIGKEAYKFMEENDFLNEIDEKQLKLLS